MIPTHLDGAKVLFLSERGNYGIVHCLGAPERDSKICYVAICQYEKETTVCLFSLDENMEVQGDTLWDSVDEAMDVAKKFYDEAPKWKPLQ